MFPSSGDITTHSSNGINITANDSDDRIVFSDEACGRDLTRAQTQGQLSEPVPMELSPG